MQGNSTGAAGDDFVPAPDAISGTAPKAAAVSAGVIDNRGDVVPITLDAGVGQTALILSLAAFLVLAVILLFVRSAIRRSLIAARATIDAASAASWAWYVTLLIFGGLLIGGIVGHLFALVSYLFLTVGVLVVGSGASAMMTSRARRSA